MMNSINKTICDMISNAIDKKLDESNKDVTYICRVTKIFPDNPKTYRLTHNDMNYVVTLTNITLKMNDKVHLVLPQGKFKNKYVLEDASIGILQRNIEERLAKLEEKISSSSL